MKRKIILLVSVTAALFSFSGCGREQKNYIYKEDEIEKVWNQDSDNWVTSTYSGSELTSSKSPTSNFWNLELDESTEWKDLDNWKEIDSDEIEEW